MPSHPRVILHVDMDAFYAAVEVREEPRLAGRPLIIGHKGPRGVVSTCSYEARPYGVRSAMPSIVAMRLCPQATWLPGRMGLYMEVSRRIRSIFDDFTPLVEPLSIDEAFLDLTGVVADLRGGAETARRLKETIRARERLGASVGVAVYPDDATTADDLLKNADLALHSAKSGGRGKCRQYTDALGQARQRRMALSGQLRGAIDNGDIQAFFQPLVHTHDLHVCGFETLARWFHPEFGAVPPPEFVRLAEENGLIDPLTDLMLRYAVEAARQWPNDVRVSVNVSPIQLNGELVDRVRDIIKSSQLDPRRLELEVTEDVLIKDFEQTASMFARLRALGVQVAMDDFGAGFTSMGNLRRLNFERIKIDRIFTMDLPNHRRAAAIVRAMFVLARELKLDVTVEGVETQEQFAFLREQGCTEVQGFLFSQPKPLSAFADLAALKLGPAEAAAPRSAPVVDLVDARRSKRAG